MDVNISTVYPQLVYDYTSKSASPTVKLSVFAEVSNGGNRIQSVTLKNSENGMSWTADDISVIPSVSSKKKYAGYSAFCMPGYLSFEKGVYQVIFEDKAGKTTEARFSLNQDEADKYASTALEKIDKQYLVVSSEGRLLYSGSYSNTFSSKELVKQEFPEADYYREYVLNVDLNAIYLMPIVRLDDN